HTRDIARRLALESYIAIAPDFLSLGGGATPADEDRARAMIGALDAGQVRDAAVAALAYGRGGRPDTTGRTAITGFCWGGRVANDAAVADAALDAAVPFYGSQPPAAAPTHERARLLRHYAGEDQRINAGIRDWTEALAAAGVAYEMHMYEDAQHAFMNDTNAARYNADAAALAWQRTIAFLDSALKG
ncbi:MAG: dienelactone hydrolase family protein, partial [Alphaproteobacteria bacterium]